MDEIFEQSEKKRLKVVFGLEAQGHIPTIQAEIKRWNDSYKEQFPSEPCDMLYSRPVWEGIGMMIGWDPFAAALSYFKWINDRRSEDINKILDGYQIECQLKYNTGTVPDAREWLTKYSSDAFPSFTFNVCPICGNKRCPHATDRNYECTNSNDVGQIGTQNYQLKIK